MKICEIYLEQDDDGIYFSASLLGRHASQGGTEFGPYSLATHDLKLLLKVIGSKITKDIEELKEHL